MATSGAVGWMRKQASPVTLTICGLLIAGFLGGWAVPAIRTALDFNGFSLELWRLFTYPFAGYLGLIGLLFTLLWMFWVGSSVERDHGTKNFIILWAIISLLGVVPIALFGGRPIGIFVPEAILTAIYAARNPEMEIRIYGIIPLKMKWLALIMAGVVFFMYASTGAQALYGLLAVLGCILGWFYGQNKIPGVRYALAGTPSAPKQTKAQKQKEEAYYSDVFLREKERADRERLRKLLEGNDDRG